MFVWPQDGYAIGFERVREKSDGIFAECVVGVSERANGHGGHIARRSLNLLATQTRSQFSKFLAERSNNTSHPITADTWTDWLEWASETTVEQLRAGEPFVDTALENAELEPKFLIDHFLPDNETTILVADGETGKGWLAISLAISVMRGHPLLPRLKVLRSGPVVYLDYEAGREEFKRRRAWIERGLGLNERIHVVHRVMSRPILDDIDRIRAEVRQRDAALVIIDSLGPMTGQDLDAGHNATGAMTVLNLLPCPRLVLAHVSKAVAQQTNGRGRVLGSVMFENLARSVWEMRHEEGGDGVAIFHRKSNIGPHQPEIAYRQIWNDAEKSYRIQEVDLMETSDLQQFANLRERLQVALRKGAKKTSELAEMTDTDPDTILRSIKRWHEFTRLPGPAGRGHEATWGLAVKDENGKFVPF